MSNKAAMKLGHINQDEVYVSFHVNCRLCDKSQSSPQRKDYHREMFIRWAANQGWHSYETDNETCSAACPNCIKEVRENLTETTEEPTA